MPAIQLSRLRRQAVELAEHFETPDTFMSQFSNLLEFYADRTHRPMQSGQTPLLKAYRIADPVLRRILLELDPLCRQSPFQALALADACWRKEVLEFRLLAINILEKIPASMVDEILSRVRTWNQENLEASLLAAMTTIALQPLRQENLDAYLGLVETSLAADSFIVKRLGMQAMVELLKDPQFGNLPAVYRMLTPTLEKASKPLRPDLLEVIRLLAKRSPQETAFFLRQRLVDGETAHTPWLIRKSIDVFPPEMEKGLRDVIRGR